MATKTWNNTQSQIKDLLKNTFSTNELKIFLFDFNLNLYQTQGFRASSGRNFYVSFYFCLLLSQDDWK